jgi:hypothetical protein
MRACKECGAPAIEQVRGGLVEGDKGYIEPSSGVEHNSNHPVNAPDTRVVCSNLDCDNQTGWNKTEFADYTRFKWDRDHGRDAEGSGLQHYHRSIDAGCARD